MRKFRQWLDALLWRVFRSRIEMIVERLVDDGSLLDLWLKSSYGRILSVPYGYKQRQGYPHELISDETEKAILDFARGKVNRCYGAGLLRDCLAEKGFKTRRGVEFTYAEAYKLVNHIEAENNFKLSVRVLIQKKFIEKS